MGAQITGIADMRETLWSLLATWTPDAQFKSVKN